MRQRELMRRRKKGKSMLSGSERKPLPPPTLAGEAYLHAIATELRDLHDTVRELLAQQAPVTTGDEIELKEPAKGKGKGSKVAD